MDSRATVTWMPRDRILCNSDSDIFAARCCATTSASAAVPCPRFAPGCAPDQAAGPRRRPPRPHGPAPPPRWAAPIRAHALHRLRRRPCRASPPRVTGSRVGIPAHALQRGHDRIIRRPPQEPLRKLRRSQPRPKAPRRQRHLQPRQRPRIELCACPHPQRRRQRAERPMRHRPHPIRHRLTPEPSPIGPGPRPRRARPMPELSMILPPLVLPAHPSTLPTTSQILTTKRAIIFRQALLGQPSSQPPEPQPPGPSRHFGPA